MSGLEKNVRRLARLDLPGAGQVTVAGKHAYVGHITNKQRLRNVSASLLYLIVAARQFRSWGF